MEYDFCFKLPADLQVSSSRPLLLGNDRSPHEMTFSPRILSLSMSNVIDVPATQHAPEQSMIAMLAENIFSPRYLPAFSICSFVAVISLGILYGTQWIPMPGAKVGVATASGQEMSSSSVAKLAEFRASDTNSPISAKMPSVITLTNPVLASPLAQSTVAPLPEREPESSRTLDPKSDVAGIAARAVVQGPQVLAAPYPRTLKRERKSVDVSDAGAKSLTAQPSLSAAPQHNSVAPVASAAPAAGHFVTRRSDLVASPSEPSLPAPANPDGNRERLF